MKITGLGFYDANGATFKTDKELIVENIRRILNTRRGERINDLSFGSDVSKYLFMPELDITFVANEVKNSIERCEPRVEVIDVTFNVQNEIANVIVRAKIKSSNEEITTTVGV